MERVQYSLERTLPSLHVLDSTKTFTRDELRALTAQRQALETALVRRIANRDGSDYIAYVAFEDKIEQLRLVRTAKAEAQAQADRRRLSKGKSSLLHGQDDETPVGGTKEQQARLRAAYLARCIAIFERGVTKLKDCLPLWRAYLAWARARNMRIVVGRVFARALNLHTTHISLWIQAAGYELGTNYAANTARLLLQRAIALNTIAFTEVAVVQAGQPAVKKEDEDGADGVDNRPSKRRRQDTKPPISTSVQHRPIAFTINLTPGERDLLRLWIEYARMELVFLERLRRRWAILGLAQDGGATTKTANVKREHAASGISQRFSQSGRGANGEVGAVVGGQTIDTAKLVSLPGDHAEGIDDEAGADDLRLSGGGGDNVAHDDEADALREAHVPSGEEPPKSARPLVATPAQAAQQIIMSGGLLSPLINTAFTSVAPKLRLALALGLLKLLRTFPLLDADDEDESDEGGQDLKIGDGSSTSTTTRQVRAKLAEQILDAFARSTQAVPPPPTHSSSSTSKTALTASNGTARALLLSATPLFLSAPSLLSTKGRKAREAERESHKQLCVQGRLCAVEDEEVDGMLSLARESFKRGSSLAPGAAEVGRDGNGERDRDGDGNAHLLSLQLIEVLTLLVRHTHSKRSHSKSASAAAALPLLLGQFVANLLQCRAASVKREGRDGSKGEDKGTGEGTSAITAAYYGLALSAHGEEERFGRVAAGVLRALLAARLPVSRRQPGQVREQNGGGVGEGGGGEGASEDEEDEADREGHKHKREEEEGPLLIQETNLRALLETSIKRLLA